MPDSPANTETKTMSQRRFSWRSFTTLLLAWTFLTLTLSGVVLYIAPPGRIANWTQWKIVAFTKSQWQAIHVLTAIVFLTVGLIHVLKFNWKVFTAYLKKRGDSGTRFGREIVSSAIVFLTVVIATASNLPPFGTVMTVGESIKESWDEPAQAPPVPHLEEQKMSNIALLLKIEPEAASQLLTQKGMTVPADKNVKLKEVARQNRTSPQSIYAALQPAGVKPTPGMDGHQPGSGSGLGERTVAAVAKELGMTPEAAVSAFAAQNIHAKPEESLREVAFRQGKRPFEIMGILQNVAKK
jgi:hypothetical protein